MLVEVVTTASQVRLRVHGDLDLASGVQLEREVVRAVPVGGSDVTLDLSDVSFVDCAGLRALLSSMRSVRRGGSHLSLTDSSRAVSRLSSAVGAGRFLQPV